VAVNAAMFVIPLLVSLLADHSLRPVQLERRGVEQLPVATAEHDGLRLTAFVMSDHDESQLHLELKNVSAGHVLVFDPDDGPARIWDASGFVLEKRSSNEDWRRRGFDAGCTRYGPGPKLELREGEAWESWSKLGNLEQSWARARPPRDWPKARLRLDNVSGLVTLTRVRVRVFAPHTSSVPAWKYFSFFPTQLADDDIPSVEVKVELGRALYVLPPEEGRALRDGMPPGCSCFR